MEYSNQIVEKSNALNEMIGKDWSLNELRLLAIYLAEINPRNADKSTVRLSLSEFTKTMGFNHRVQVKELKPLSETLVGKIVHVPDNKGGFDTFTLFQQFSVKLDEDEGRYYITLTPSEQAKPLLFDLKKHYTKYELWNVLQLRRSKYHLRMYETLKQYQYLGEKTLTVKVLRERLGVEEGKYTRWERFKSCIIDNCQAALANLTDIKFEYEAVRKGKQGKIGEVRFIINENTEYERLPKQETLNVADDDTIFGDKVAITATVTDAGQINRADELARAKQSPIWYYALETANNAIKKNKSIKATPERYAVGILKKWEANGYKHEGDLRKSGEIPSDMQKPSFDLDEITRLQNENYPTNRR